MRKEKKGRRQGKIKDKEGGHWERAILTRGEHRGRKDGHRELEISVESERSGVVFYKMRRRTCNAMG